MANNALKYYQNATYHIETVRNAYKSYMKSTNIPKKGSVSVMDIGVGSGRVLHEVILPLLPKNVTEIVGCDIDEKMLDFCRSMNKDPKITFEKLNIDSEEVPKHLQNRFDLLFSSYCFTYVKDLRKGFANFSKLLKPGGELLQMFQFKTNALYTTYRTMSKMDKWKSYTKDYANYTTHLSSANPEEELKKLMKDIGLTILEYEFDYDNLFSMSKREVLDSYKSLDSKVLALPKDLQAEYLKDFLRIFSEETDFDFLDEKTIDDQIKFNFPTVFLHAKK